MVSMTPGDTGGAPLRDFGLSADAPSEKREGSGKKEFGQDHPEIREAPLQGRGEGEAPTSSAPMGTELGEMEGGERAEDKKTISPEQNAHLRKQSMKRKAGRVANSAGAVLLSPLVLLGGGVIALTKLLSPEKNLWDLAMRKAILPASFRENIPDKPKPSETCKHFTVESLPNARGAGKLDAMVLLAKGVDPRAAAKLPCVVLFCQNMAAMEDGNMQKLAGEYQEKGFNVVMFNYRGVGGSEGQVMKGQDLYEDGMAVVDKLIDQGFNVGTEDHPILLQPEAKDVVLDGSSIGGAVATYVGARRPEAVLVANRTFTKWTDAAEGLVAKFSNPLCAKFAKAVLNRSKKADMDNVWEMERRMRGQTNFTIIESAGVTGDGVLATHAKLTESVMRDQFPDDWRPEIHGESIVRKGVDAGPQDLVDHNTYIPLSDRTKLSELVVEPHAAKIEGLKMASELKKRVSNRLAIIEEGKERLNREILLGTLGDNIQRTAENLKKFADKIDQDTPYLEQIKEMFDEIDTQQIDDAIENLKDKQRQEQAFGDFLSGGATETKTADDQGKDTNSDETELGKAIKQLQELKIALGDLKKTIAKGAAADVSDRGV